MASAYQAISQGDPVDLPPLDISYADYALWQRNYLKGENLANMLTYWQQQLSDFETLELPTDHPRPPQQDYLKPNTSLMSRCLTYS